MRKVVYYRTTGGDCPVEYFLGSLTAKQFEKITWVLKVVRELPVVPKQYFKKLAGTDDIWEVRVDSGNDTFRLLGFLDRDNFVVLTNAFSKKTDKTPASEIRLAEQRKKDYERRRNG